MLKKLFTTTTCCCLLAISAGLMLAPHTAQAFAPPRKKLIEAGWERTTASDMLQYWKIMEQTPYDGIVFAVNGMDDQGKQVELKNVVFNPKPIKLSWFKDDIKRLRSFHSTKLTDNFPIITVRGNPPDWFDDKGWAVIVNNWKIAATVAKEANLKGICFDPEMYSGAKLWTYGAQQGTRKHSYAEYCAKARQRGREMMRAVSSVYPDMVFFTFSMNELNRAYADGGIEGSRYGLYPACINGWLDGASPLMTIVDGGESAYTYSTPEQFLSMANWIRNTGLQFVAPENRNRYRSQVQVCFGLYLDAYSYYKLDSTNPRDRRYALQPLNGSRLNRLKSNVDAAMNASDEYVWTWGEHYHWWPTKNKSAGDKTWEEVLPGTTKVLLDATHPKQRQLLRRTLRLPQISATQAPKIDGNLNDALYSQYPWTEPFVTLLSNNDTVDNKPAAATKAFAAWDANNLYIAFRCDQPDIQHQHVAGVGHDSDIWGGESLEVAILKPGQRAGLAGTAFYHFILNPANVHWDGIHAQGKDDMKYDPAWRSGTQKNQSGWTAEIQIPWKGIGISAPHKGMKVQANFAHNRKDSGSELSSWSQFIGGFQEPQNLGTWVLR